MLEAKGGTHLQMLADQATGEESSVNRNPEGEPCITSPDPSMADVPEKFEAVYRKDIFLDMFSKHIFSQHQKQEQKWFLLMMPNSFLSIFISNPYRYMSFSAGQGKLLSLF